MTLKEARIALLAKSKAIQAIHDEAGPDLDFSKVKSLEGDTKGKVEKLQAMNKELSDLKDSYDAMVKLDEGAKMARGITASIKEPDGAIKQAEKPQRKTLLDAFVESKAGREYKGRPVEVPDFEVKTLMEASDGWDPDNVRSGLVSPYPVQALGVLNYIPMGTTGSDLYKYMKGTTFTNNAAEVSEGGQYGEAALVYTETSDEVEKVGVWLPITEEQLEDNPGLDGIVNSDLTYMLKAKLEAECLVGNGASPNLLGTLSLASLQSQALGTDSVPDAIHKAITKVRVTGFAEPNVIFMHPNDWQGVRLLTTADGIYIYGSPMDAGVQRMWGVPVVATTFETENTAIVGDYARFSKLLMRRGIRFEVTNAHDTYFINGKLAIRCDLRAVMVHTRDTAFCKVTGI